MLEEIETNKIKGANSISNNLLVGKVSFDSVLLLSVLF